MSLLDDLKEDLREAQLKAVASAKPKNEWHEPTTWKFGGYLARVVEHICPQCQKATHSLSLGVFAEEVGSNGTRTLTKAHQFPLSDIDRRVEVEQIHGEPCIDCLASIGFTNYVSAPQVATNIRGEGMLTTPGFRNGLGFIRKSE